MDLSTALIIPLFVYGIFVLALAIEYFTDKRKKKIRIHEHPMVKHVKADAPKKKNGIEQLKDLEAGAEEKTEKGVGAPKIWEEEEFQ